MQSGPIAKIATYAVLIALAVLCAGRFIGKYSALMDAKVDSDPYAITTLQVPAQAPDANPGGTNDPAGGESSLPTELDGTEPAVTATNSPSRVSPSPEIPVLNSAPQPMTKLALDRSAAPDVSGIGFYAVTTFGLILVLGLLGAHDISHYLGVRAQKLLIHEEGIGGDSEEYDRAEEVWANGDHLEAVRLLREYLNRHPRAVHVMVRIAEIYEKDLNNFLAAALEYEELLKQRLPAEQWGWAAIHLVNLYYGKLGQPDKGLALLRRIDQEYGQTSAAQKARKRLAEIDPEFVPPENRAEEEEEEDETPASEWEEVVPPPDIPATPEDPGPLPRGFRPKK